ncbi:MAG: hypothetical protein P8R42_10265 [Candidatus Binatia bacterium]|nr:hypothetical protein [Candidatus Binatia bacterium]
MSNIAVRRDFLTLADVTAYTSYMAENKLEHAQAVMAVVCRQLLRSIDDGGCTIDAKPHGRSCKVGLGVYIQFGSRPARGRPSCEEGWNWASMNPSSSLRFPSCPPVLI